MRLRYRRLPQSRMIDTVLSLPPEPTRHRRWLPFGDPSRPRRLAKVLAWLVGIALALAVLESSASTSSAGSDLWDALSAIGLGYLLAGWTLQTLKTSLTAFAWYSILRVAFPDGRVTFLQILAAYAAGVALNGFLPANIGTAVTLLMYVAIIPGANLPGVLGGMIVHKIFFSLAAAFVYVYLILSAPGSLNVQLPALEDRPGLFVAIVAGAAMLLLIVVRIFWHKFQGLWAKAVQGGAILARRREYLLGVALPSFGAWLARLGVIAVFLAGYGITVTFHTVMAVVGSGRSPTPSPSPPAASASTRRPTSRAPRRDRHRHRHRVLHRPTTRDHRLERRLRRRARRLGVRLDRRKDPGRTVLHRRQGQGLRAKGPTRGSQDEQTSSAPGPALRARATSTVKPTPLLRWRPRARRPVGGSCGTSRTARRAPRGSARAAPPEGRGWSRRC